ncbi:hypothetical protein [Natronorubrum halalkaliphilum]|uniref:hypothetical protein n=1 Tax=Natronorubrum halalkaliphilum TaxID=2691917 RepID=UPI001F29E979|nr:hypothetical protein [Natronorubrum halalkaliphilum]
MRRYADRLKHEFKEGSGVVVLAIRRGDGWTFDPTDDLACASDETLLVRGPPLGVDRLRELASDGDGDGLE